MGRIEIHPRTFTRNRSGTPTAERRFLDTPDVTVEEPLPAIGSEHPEFAALVCVSITATSGHNGDPQQTMHSVKYEKVLR